MKTLALTLLCGQLFAFSYSTIDLLLHANCEGVEWCCADDFDGEEDNKPDDDHKFSPCLNTSDSSFSMRSVVPLFCRVFIDDHDPQNTTPPPEQDSYCS